MPTRRGQLAAVLLCAAVAVVACSTFTTEAPLSGDVFDAPVDGLTPAEAAAFVRGDAEFARRFSPATGLGPIFNNASCASCHSGDGRGVLENALHRIGSADDGFLRAMGGPQIQDKAIP
ncbi:MAG TPA: di-heme oxidoredictase family protein, partial [Gemmatimonadaceae bacterium]